MLFFLFTKVIQFSRSLEKMGFFQGRKSINKKKKKYILAEHLCAYKTGYHPLSLDGTLVESSTGASQVDNQNIYFFQKIIIDKGSFTHKKPSTSSKR